MLKVLIIKGNPKPLDEATSLQLLENFKKGLFEKNNYIQINEIDLYLSPPPYYDYKTYRYFWYPLGMPDYNPSKEEIEAINYSKKNIELVNNSDILVICCPMWNFSFPAIVKAWIDQILMPQETFYWNENGEIFVHHNIKKAILLTTAGGEYFLNDPRDHITSLFKTICSFIKITNTYIIFADRQNPFFYDKQEEIKNKSLDEAYKLGLAIVNEK